MSRIPDDYDRCQYVTTDGKRCRLLRRPDDILCTPHSVVLHSVKPDPCSLGNELLGPFDSLESARGVQRYLRRVIQAVADKRLDARQASALTYLGQMTMQSLSHIRKELEPPRRPAAEESPFKLLVALLATGTPEEVLNLRSLFQRGIVPGQGKEVSTDKSPSELAEHIMSVLASDANPHDIATLANMLQRIIALSGRSGEIEQSPWVPRDEALQPAPSSPNCDNLILKPDIPQRDSELSTLDSPRSDPTTSQSRCGKLEP